MPLHRMGWLGAWVVLLCGCQPTQAAASTAAKQTPFKNQLSRLTSWATKSTSLTLVPGSGAFVHPAAQISMRNPYLRLTSSNAAFVGPSQQVGMSITVGMSALSNGSGGRGPSAIRKGDGSQDKVGEGAVRKKNSPQPPHPAAGYDGIIAVHKPTNCTSFDVVAKVRGTIGKYIRDQSPGVPHKQCRVKVGHGGTLDPAATGVLVIGIGKGTKMMDLYTKGSKSYKAVGLFGHETDTGDAEGVNTGDEMGFEHVTQEKLENSLKKFVGNITQVPPQYSAIKKDGVKAYELARKGVEVEMTPRAITIHSISLSRPFAETSPAFEFEVSCGGGTYIRSLVRDIARDLGSAAHMCALVRTKQGEFTLDDCIDADNIFQADKILSAMPGKLGEALDGVQDEAHHEGGGSKSKEE